MKLYRVKFSKGWPCTVRAEHMGAAIEIARTWRHKQKLAGAWDITKVTYMGLESSVLGSPDDPPIVYLKEDGTIEKIERGPIQIVTSPARWISDSPFGNDRRDPALALMRVVVGIASMGATVALGVIVFHVVAIIVSVGVYAILAAALIIAIIVLAGAIGRLILGAAQ